jgi:photosystem II stability/assembly factor-like uncharacterized protein
VKFRRLIPLVSVVWCVAATAAPQPIDSAVFGALKWRLIGPFRAGRVSAGAVDPLDPNTYYLGAAGGGVWKTTNAGQTWKPIFDATGVASIGALAVAPSNHDVIYVGTGEETRGNGVYKSTDGGSTWTNVGLADTHFIGSIVIDVANPDIVLVGAIGDRAPGPHRGVFRTTDGGRTWNRVLFRDASSGCPSIIAAADEPAVLFATLYPGAAARGAAPAPPIGPGASSLPPVAPLTPPPAIYKSVDGGATWQPLAAKGLPGPAVGRQAFAVVAGSRGQRVFAGVRDGVFRSNDGGESWERWTADPRIKPFGVIADPRDPNVVYVTQTSLYRSMDGGRTFDAFAGAPSGDDFQLLWIDPRNSRRLLAGVDQGGIVSVDGGESWSSWYNQPTGQFYHVSTDGRFPYHVLAAQQDSGSVAVPNRSDYGQITFRDWYSPGGFEFGYVAADPLDPDVVFAGGWYRTVIRFDRRTGQVAHVFAPGTRYRSVNNAPLGFSPQDPHTLYLGTQFLMKSTDGGVTWREASPDLTDVAGKAVPVVAGLRGSQGASITTFSASKVKAGVIWAATTNGVVQLTDNGGSAWRDVSPPALPAGGAFEIIESGRHDAATAYATLIVPQDVRPYIYRTHDKGKTWEKIVTGLPDTAVARVVREDPVRRRLLYCGTESGVYVSFDDGERWQSLQLNLPASSMRDMVVEGDDLVLATYGRALWILDNLTPLRQVTPQVLASDVRLLMPAPAVRVRWDVNGDTPLPVETPTGTNPPDGAIIDYYLRRPPAGDLTLTIYDTHGDAVRTYSSVAPPDPTLLPNVPSYWFAPAAVLTKHAGLNRFAWNLRLPNPKVLPFAYSGGMLTYVEYTVADHAIPGQTPREQPEGALVVPGRYTVELKTGGRTERQELIVKPDPRIRASHDDLIVQFDVARRVSEGLAVSFDGYGALARLRAGVVDRLTALGEKEAPAETVAAARRLDERVNAVQNGTPAHRGLGLVNRDLARYFNMLESSDTRPAATLRAAITDTCEALNLALAAWRDVNDRDVPAYNAQLQQHGLPPLPEPSRVPPAIACR